MAMPGRYRDVGSFDRFAAVSSEVGWSSYGPAPEKPRDEGRPELGDLRRLARRAVRKVVRVARAEEGSPIARALAAHLGPGAERLPVVEEAWAGYDHVNVATGLEAWLAEPGRSHEVMGLTNFRHRQFGLADLIDPQDAWGTRPGSVATVNLPCGPDGANRACPVCAVYLVRDDTGPTALLLRGPDPHGEHGGTTIEAVSPVEGAAAAATTAVRRLALAHNVYRGHILSFGGDVFEDGGGFLRFHTRPRLDRSQLVLPDEVFDAVERQVVGVALQRERLLASGQHLKRGLLLYGPPGTGKTHTIRYLLSRLTTTTVVVLSGNALHLVSEACSVARTLAPAMVVVEDVDLIAEERGMHPGNHPMLFELLNQMDGLAEDADVVFVLTTNRADLLEPALAARPGRVDQAVELTVPDADGRRALMALYRGRLDIDLDRVDDVVQRTDGVTASFLKELLRRAAVVAAAETTGGDGPLTVTPDQLRSALDDLLTHRNALTRVLLGSDPGHEDAR